MTCPAQRQQVSTTSETSPCIKREECVRSLATEQSCHIIINLVVLIEEPSEVCPVFPSAAPGTTWLQAKLPPGRSHLNSTLPGSPASDSCALSCAWWQLPVVNRLPGPIACCHSTFGRGFTEYLTAANNTSRNCIHYKQRTRGGKAAGNRN